MIQSIALSSLAIAMVCLIVCQSTAQGINGGTDFNTTEGQKVFEFMMKNYKKTTIPMMNISEPIVISLGITLTQILNLDEKNEVLTIKVYLDQKWNDSFLTWNSTQFGNLERIRVPIEYIWKPDIVLYESTDELLREYKNSLAIVESNGTVFWPTPIILRSKCKLDIRYFSFDEQKCSLTFGSYLHDNELIDVVKLQDKVELAEYMPNGKWDLVNTTLVRNVKMYPAFVKPFPEVTMTLTIRRKRLYYVYKLIVPIFILLAVLLLGFFVPPDSGEKLSIGVTVLLAFFFHLSDISDKLPETSDSIPYFGICLVILMVLTAASLMISVIVLRCTYRTKRLRNKPLPKWHRFVPGLEESLAELRGNLVSTTTESDILSQSPSEPLNAEEVVTRSNQPSLSAEPAISLDYNVRQRKSILRTMSGHSSQSQSTFYQRKQNAQDTRNQTLGEIKGFRETLTNHILVKEDRENSDSTAAEKWRLLGDHIDWLAFKIVLSIIIILFVILAVILLLPSIF